MKFKSLFLFSFVMLTIPIFCDSGILMSVSGRVINKLTGSPIKAEISLYVYDKTMQEVIESYSAETDANGNYCISKIPAGYYKIWPTLFIPDEKDAVVIMTGEGVDDYYYGLDIQPGQNIVLDIDWIVVGESESISPKRENLSKNYIKLTVYTYEKPL